MNLLLIDTGRTEDRPIKTSPRQSCNMLSYPVGESQIGNTMHNHFEAISAVPSSGNCGSLQTHQTHPISINYHPNQNALPCYATLHPTKYHESNDTIVPYCSINSTGGRAVCIIFFSIPSIGLTSPSCGCKLSLVSSTAMAGRSGLSP